MGEGPWKLGAVSYLNAKPLVEGLAERSEVELITAVPAELAGMLLAGEVDAALIPVVDYLRYEEVLERVSDACIAADGATMTVRVYSPVAPEAMDVLRADTESHTSVVLAQVLWSTCYQKILQVRPLEAGDRPGAGEAVLLIGDKVVSSSWNRGVHDIDLGQLWKKQTGLPFVFAVWAARRGEGGAATGALLESARNLGVARAEQIARDCAAAHGWKPDRAVSYLAEHMKYSLEPAFVKGMETFLGLASGMGLASAVARGVAGEMVSTAKANRVTSNVSLPRVSEADALEMFRDCSLHELGRRAHEVTMALHPESYRTYVVDRNINYSNVCTAHCAFCNFKAKPGAPDAYVLKFSEISAKIAELEEIGGTQILMQGGLAPAEVLPFSWYEELLRSIKCGFPNIHIHAFSPPEVFAFSKVFGMSIRDVLLRLQEAGLDTIPGGGAEILADRVRRKIGQGKTLTSEYLEVMREAHGIGMRTSITMMFGHIETWAERIEHLSRIRELQDETGGFTAFICWTFQPERTPLGRKKIRPAECTEPPDGVRLVLAGAHEYLKTLAISRVFLHNVINIQASWVTQGPKIGQLALFFGANDMGSVMMEENVVSAAGTTYRLAEQEIRDLIADTGWQPRKRNCYYEIIEPEAQSERI